MGSFNPDNTAGQGTLGISNQSGTQLMAILNQDDIEPGADPSYAACKTIYSYHPLGSKMVDAPLSLAQSMPRTLTVPNCPEEELLKAWRKEWDSLGRIGADRLILNTMRTARIYGIASIVTGTREEKPDVPLDMWTLHKQDLYFNVLDPLNTAGSLVLDQDPNAPDYQKPRAIRSGPITYHPTRAVVVMNEEPLYIQWSNSAFGFVGRSVYQRALFPLKSFIRTMITDDMITQKSGVIVFKQKTGSSIVDNVAQVFSAAKRALVKIATLGNILQIGVGEDVESLDLNNLKDPYELARNNIMKNIATAANMPASMINQETLAEGFGEGTEDAKQIARYIDGVRIEMRPLYEYFDNLVMHRAWSPEFYKTIQRNFPEYETVRYETAFYQWKNAFTAEWPNLLVEPDSKAVERDAKIMESAIGVAEIALPACDPDNKAAIIAWLADTMNARKMLVSSPLNIDQDALAAYTPPTPEPKEPETRAAYDI